MVSRPPEGRVDVLAQTAGGPVWIQRADEQWSVLPPIDLEPEASLREQFRDGTFFALVPLVHWLREVAPEKWSPPRLRASFLFDDPNLHWTSYGFIRYRDMVRHAREHGYAATMAIVPRDLWGTHPGAARTFHDSDGLLSLAIHGNDHVKRELARGLPTEARRALLAQAMQRVCAFESRSGLRVARVMVPPHGETSREMVLDMPRLGVEAMTDSRPYPWLERAPPDAPLAGWRPIDVVGGGFPVMPRYHLARSREDIPLRAFLGQPVILYGHHGDLANGLDVLAAAADYVRTVGSAEWMPVGAIAHSNYTTRVTGNTLEVRLLNPVVAIRAPNNVDAVVVDASLLGSCDGLRVFADHETRRHSLANGKSEPIPIEDRSLHVEITRAMQLAHETIAPPAFRIWPLARRVASEGRDRLMPVARRLRVR